MTGRIWTFVLGFVLGGLTLVILRHELSLNSHVRTVSMLAGVGALLVVVLWVWARRLRVHAQQHDQPTEPGPWPLYLWCTAILVAIYLTLATIVLFV